MFISNNKTRYIQEIGHKPCINYFKIVLRIKEVSQEKLLYGKFIICEEITRFC